MNWAWGDITNQLTIFKISLDSISYKSLCTLHTVNWVIYSEFLTFSMPLTNDVRNL